MSKQDYISAQGAVTLEGKPFVVVEWSNERGQLDPGSAIEVGMNFITAAIEAERDAGLMRFGKCSKLDVNMMRGLLTGIREHRPQAAVVALPHPDSIKEDKE